MSKYADITLPGLIACVVLVCSLLLLGCASSKKSFLTEDYYGVTNNPSDPIGWATTFQSRTGSALLGIPYGRIPQRYLFKTSEACESARLNFKFRQTGTAALWSQPEVPPSTPCEPVHYILKSYLIPTGW